MRAIRLVALGLVVLPLAAGLILLVFGALLLWGQYGLVDWWTWARVSLVILILIVAGLVLLARRKA